MHRGTAIVFSFLLALSVNAQSGISPVHEYVGCLQENTEIDKLQNTDFPFTPSKENAGDSIDACVEECLTDFFRYAALQNLRHCKCGSKYDPIRVADERHCDKPCRSNSSQICGGDYASSIYDTGQRGSGPPLKVKVSNITETGFHISWSTPTAPNGVLKNYAISAEVLSTHDLNPPPILTWTYPEDVLSTDVDDLFPGSKYLVKVQADNDLASGIPAPLTVGTKIGYPNTPREPEIVAKILSKGQVVIRFDEGLSHKGPITGYRVIVVCGLAEFDPDLLDSYDVAQQRGLSYYITARLGPDAYSDNFTVGDNLVYGGFKNVALRLGNEQCTEEDLQFSIGVISSDETSTCISYSTRHELQKIVIPEPKESEGLQSWLVVAIVVCSVLLVLVIMAYFAARHFAPKHRRGASRMEDPQEMSLQGPIIEVENFGYVPEEEEDNRVDHADRLKKILWDIPRNFLDLQANNILGTGDFGTFMKGTVLQNGYPVLSSVHCIEDGRLSPTTKRSMLQELATLIKSGTGNHSNVIRLVGTCESPEMLYVVLEYHPATLKDILLESRTLEHPGYDRNLSSVCSLPQQAFLQIGVGIAQGMAHLASQKVIHKQLAACSVLMADGMVPKITNFGIAKCNRPNMVADYTRWTAREIFRSQHFTVKSDVWSMGCLLWEMAALGGTLYSTIPTADVTGRVMRGARLAHLSHISDDFYQLMLQCWQLDLDERPSFSEILSTLCELINSGETHLDWSVVPGFQYEQYLSDLESFHQR